MAERAEAPSGSIYDLGYRNYTGPRLGRRYAIASLYVYSLRAVFGLGHSLLSKVFPFGLAIVALVPALAQLAIAAISPAKVEFILPENYFRYVQIVVVLFCAVVTPEIVGRDQRHHTLPLYFSRALARADYVSAKLGALAVALFIVVGLPQVVLILGNAVAADDLVSYLQHHVDDLAPVLGGAALVAAFMAAVSLAVASQTPRRAFATGAVLAYFVVLSALGSTLVRTTTGDLQRYAILVSPIDVLDGGIHWLFNARSAPDSDISQAGLAGGVYIFAALAYTLAALAVLYRRFLRLSV